MNRRLPTLLNRSLLFVAGIICLVTGIGIILTLTWDTAAKYWSKNTKELLTHYQYWYDRLPGIYANTSWIELLPALIAILILLVLILWAKPQIGRKTTELGEETSQQSEGKTTVSPSFVAALLQQKLKDKTQISSIKVNGWEEKNNNLLNIRINTLKGAHPGEIKNKTRQAITQLDQILGKEIPILVHITSDWKNTFSNAKRVDKK